MGITNNSVLEAASTVYRSLASEVLQQSPPGTYQLFTESMPVDSLITSFDVLGAFPKLVEWAGAKEFGSAEAYSVSMRVKPFHKSFRIARLSASLDRTGQIAASLRRFLTDVNQNGLDQLAHEELFANRTCYDGVSLFNTAHPDGPDGATQANRSATALSFAQHEAVLRAGAELRSINGEPLGISYDTLIVGPKNAKLAKEITMSTERVIGINASGVEATASVVAAAGIPNVFGGGDMTLIVDPRLVGSYDDHYYYLDTKKPGKPIVMGVARGLEAITQESMDAEGRFINDELRFSVEADLAFCPGMWQLAYAGIL